jgi:twitching motility protein PilT
MTPLAKSIELCCKAAVEYKASDVILRSDEPPMLRISGSVTFVEMPSISKEEMASLRAACKVPESASDHDASLFTSDGLRFRVNFHQHLGRDSAVLRLIKTSIPDLENLGVPSELLQSWAQQRSGIIIVSGPTGSGKSTTLSSLLEWVNHRLERHIVTIEDPVEFVFTGDKSYFTQRAVGLDTPSFAEGLRRSLRQAPDIILVGEIRDRETAEVALQAAETGHLVLATLHAPNACEVVERMSAFLPEDLKQGYLQVLSNQLLGVLCQKLLQAAQGGSVLACEYFSNVGIMRRLVREANLDNLFDQISISSNQEASSFLNSLYDLVIAKKITEEQALLAAPRPADLHRMLLGVSATTSF